MARIPKITNEQILEAAREVFLEKGFSGSTLEIAARSGVSEASIFKPKKNCSSLRWEFQKHLYG
jgi:AcrR family transcriptional regulator